MRERNIAMKELRRRIDEELSDFTFKDIPESRRTAPAANGKDKKMKINKKALAIFIAAAAAVGSTVTAGAATGWDYSRLIKGFFPGSEKAGNTVQRDVLSDTIQTVDPQNVTSTFENYDVAFDGAIFDGTVLMVSATIRNKDGSPFTDSNYDFKSISFPEGAKSGVGGCELNEDGSLRLYCIMSYADEKEFPTAAYTFKEFCRYPDDPNRCEMLDSGSLSVEFSVDTRCETRSFMLTDREGNVVEARLSPISVKLIQKFVVDEKRYKYTRITIMGENDPLVTPGDFRLACGETDPQTGIKNHIIGFPHPIDINSVTAITGEAYIAG